MVLQYITYTPKKNISFSRMGECLIFILGCYNAELNTGTLPDLRQSSFRKQFTVRSQYLLPQDISPAM